MKFKIPETLDGLTREQLVDLESKAIEAFDARRDDPNLDAAGMTELRALAAFITANRAAVTAMDEESAAAAAELAAMVEAIHPAQQPEQEPPEPAQPAEPDEPVEDDGQDGDDEQDGDAGTAPATRVAEPVAAAAPGPVATTTTTTSAGAGGAIALRPGGQAPARTATARRSEATGGRVVITAAADLPNYSNGHRFRDVREVGQAVQSRLAGFPDQAALPMHSRTKMFLRQGVAQFTFPSFGIVADGRNDVEAIDAACDLGRLPQRSLIAAGAWCPPPVQLWDLCPSVIAVEGTVDVPSFSFTRTGVTYPLVPDLIPDFDSIGFHYTEQDSINGTPKTCYTMPCTTWDTKKMACDGICIKGDIINDSSWPEYYDRLLGDVLKLHQLKMAKQKLDEIISYSTAVDLGAGSDIAADNTLSGLVSAILLSAADYRRRQLAASTQELEVLLPSWLPDVAFVDSLRRGNCCGSGPAGSRADITAQLGARNIRVQWITNWQDYFGSGTGLGDDVAATRWPDEVKWVIYAPGAFAFGTRNIIRLDAVYDSTLLEQNEYIRLFTEECSLLLHRCYPSYIYTMGLCPSGATAAPVDYACTGGGGGTTATGATAGSPGSFTPGGSTAPANLAAMSTVTASPTTAWTTGQYVVLGDNSHAKWNGTAWVAA